MLDLFMPPKVTPIPTRVVLNADVAPKPKLVSVKPATVKPHKNPRQPKVPREGTKYSRLTPEQRAERNKASADWYAANRERALLRAKARYAAMTPEQRAAKLAYGRNRKAAKRAAQEAVDA